MVVTVRIMAPGSCRPVAPGTERCHRRCMTAVIRLGIVDLRSAPSSIAGGSLLVARPAQDESQEEWIGERCCKEINHIPKQTCTECVRDDEEGDWIHEQDRWCDNGGGAPQV